MEQTPNSSPRPVFMPLSELLAQTVAAVHKRCWLFAQLILAIALLYILFFIVAGTVVAGGFIFGLLAGAKAVITVGLLMALALAVVWVYWGIRLTVAMLYSVQNPQINSLVEALKKAKPFAWPYFLNQLLVGVIVLVGLLFLFIPGIYLAVAYSLSLWIILDGGKAGLSTLRQSKELVKGYWWNVFGRYLFAMLVYLIAVSLLGGLAAALFHSPQALSVVNGLLNLVFLPYSLTYLYLIYQSLKQVKSVQTPGAV